jgi:5-methylcytosine-specific restriction protein A
MPTRPKTHKPACLPKRDDRPHSADRGYDARWRKARLAYLRAHPLCVACEKEGNVTPASVVDHIIPHKGDRALFWDSENNWESLCEHHHNVKTAKQDGGFGRAVRPPE